jgi:hypothetical protein
MRRGMIFFALSLLTIGSAWIVWAQRRPVTPRRATASDYTISGPYSHDNLTVFLVHGKDRMPGKTPLTLQEALARKTVLVHETKDVNQLAIENVGTEEVYVQAGDIVKGGQQDRTLAYDLIVPARSGRMALEAFCVEQGRWSGRGNESRANFSASAAQLNSKDLKLAAKRSKSQQEVWSKVSESQEKIAKNLSVNGAAGGGGGGGGAVSGGVLPAATLAPASPTSLQLTLENSEVKKSSQEYTKLLANIINDKPDAIGYVFAINGKINSADVYGTSALFRKLWPKLLEASAVEALSERDTQKASATTTVDDIHSSLTEAENGEMTTKDITRRVRLVTRENTKAVFFETRDLARDEAWIHRNYLTK